MYCKNCGKEFLSDHADVCLDCGATKGKGDKYCENCGAPVNPNQDVCLKCGTKLKEKSERGDGEPKSKMVAGLLGIFLGGLGIHNFYLGYTTKAVIQLCITVGSIFLGCCTAGISYFLIFCPVVWGFIEGILILTGHISKDGAGNPLEK